MKKILNLILPILFVTSFISCEDSMSTDNISRITYFNDIELVGEENYIIDLGATYNEPGARAFEGDKEVTDQIEITGSVDESTVGLYVVTYNIENVDGFKKAITRNVFVLPADRSTSDVYTGTYTGEVSTGVHVDATEIKHLGNGLYSCSDFIGARYNVGFGYGPVYKLPGFFYVDGDGLGFDALIINSVWGPWDIHTPSLSGTTFKHGVSNSGGTIRDVILIKQ